MTTSPENLLHVRYLFQRKTGLPAISLGIQHYRPQGGGYHEGNDLLAQGGRKDSDYSKRESSRDRPGSNEASAIDIGDFRVKLGNGRVVTEIDLHRFVERNWNAPDAQWMREYIYSLDKKKVLRLDRHNKRKSGDNSHRTHSHVSKYREVKDNSPLRFFTRFWNEMEGVTPSPTTEKDDDMKGILANLSGKATMWYGTTRNGDTRALSHQESVDALAATGAVVRTFKSAEALVESLGALSDCSVEKSVESVKSAG